MLPDFYAAGAVNKFYCIHAAGAFYYFNFSDKMMALYNKNSIA